MSPDDDDFFVKIQVKISKMTVFKRRKLLSKFQKWRATRANRSSMGRVLAWVVC